MIRRVCLITPGHIASTPRLVKEADALHAAGWSVLVIAGDYMPAVRPLDEALLQRVGWECRRVSLGRGPVHIWRTLLQCCARLCLRFSRRAPLALVVRAQNRVSVPLQQAAASVPADLYIAHCLAALPAAAGAARRSGAHYAFDAEDFHCGELADVPENHFELELRGRLERELLPGCAYLTTAAPLISAAYTERYAVPAQTVLNVFPLSQAPTAEFTAGAAAELYWFSQTIGPGRGLEELLEILKLMSRAPRLVLRGFVSSAYHQDLLRRAGPLAEQVEFLPPAPADEMVAAAAGHSLGLSLELELPRHRALCLTNKIFTYLLAGLPIVLSRTAAQDQLAAELGAAALSVDLRDAAGTAVVLQRLLDDPERLATGREAAGRLARERFNWEFEAQGFLELVQKAIEGVPSAGMT